MQKKIVAAICAAALALAMPVAAFAGNSESFGKTEVNGSIVTIAGDAKVTGDNADLTGFEMTANSDWVNGVKVASTSANASNYVAYTNDVLKQSFTIDAQYVGDEWGGSLGTTAQQAKVGCSFTIAFKDKKIADLPTTIDPSNLYTRAYIEHDNGATETRQPVNATSIAINMDRCSTVTAVLANGPLSYGQPVGTSTTADLDNAAKDGSKSPKTGELA